MTIAEVISKVDSLKPNTYAPEDKIDWLSTLDSRVKSHIIDAHVCNEPIFFYGYSDQDMETELLVPAPYDEIYLFWLEAKINYWNGEYGKYNNSIEMYNEAYTAYAKCYTREHMPKGKKFKFF